MGSMIAPTLKLGIAVLNGGNATVQQVQYCTNCFFFLGSPKPVCIFTVIDGGHFSILGAYGINVMEQKIIIMNIDKIKKR